MELGRILAVKAFRAKKNPPPRAGEGQGGGQFPPSPLSPSRDGEGVEKPAGVLGKAQKVWGRLRRELCKSNEINPPLTPPDLRGEN
jgi:hypothetical protein